MNGPSALAPSKDPLKGDRGARRRLRVVHATTRLPVGGMENVVAQLAQRLPANRYQSSICCLEEADRLGRELQDGGVDVTVLGRHRNRDLGLLWRLAWHARRERVDILHCHDELSWFYGGLAARLARVPIVIVTMHGRRPAISARHLFEQRILARGTARIVAVSDYLRKQVRAELRVSASQVVTIRNGIAMPTAPPDPSATERARRKLGLPLDSFVVGSVGELSEVKNFDLAIEAVAGLLGALPHIRLVLVGEGPLRARLEATVGDSGLAGAVHFAGVRRDIADVLPAFDVYLCSSNYEGISLSILEAMAAGRPIVATRVGGNPEIIQDGETGLLVPERDPEAMARALESLANDAPMRGRLGSAAERLVISTFHLRRMLDGYDCLYQELAADVS